MADDDTSERSHDTPRSPAEFPLLAEGVGGVLRRLAPGTDEIVREMEKRAVEEGFPTVGPEVGAFFRLCARSVDARRVFEFGSGYGYSAYWVAGALPADGEVVLTEYDADELADAREYFERAGLTDRATFERGDALEAVERHDGPFDVVLIDNESHRYVEALEAVRGKLAPGAVVLADNVLSAGGQFDPPTLAAALDDPPAEEDARGLRGMVDYLRHVRDDPALETVLVPLGEGVAVSYHL